MGQQNVQAELIYHNENHGKRKDVHLLENGPATKIMALHTKETKMEISYLHFFSK